MTRRRRRTAAPTGGEPPESWLHRWGGHLLVEAFHNDHLITVDEARRRARLLWDDLDPDLRRSITEREGNRPPVKENHHE